MSPAASRPLTRRSLLRVTGRGVVGFAVLGLVACSGDDGDPVGGTEPEPSPTETDATREVGALTWSRVDLGFVSAYVLVRGREAAVVDTGVEGSADAIAAVLDEAGPGWDGVRHVVLTHKHPDHVGSAGEVLSRATQATGYIGEADLDEVENVDGSESLRTLADDDDVFGLRIVATPGHTPGHLAVFDADTGVLLAGDALTNDGGLGEPPPDFTEDPAAAVESIRKLAGLSPETILVGHGAPVVDGAAEALDALAASLA